MATTAPTPVLTAKLDACNKVLVVYADGKRVQKWTGHTFNAWSGCTKVSPGCAHCYAETLSKRNPKTLGVWGKGSPRVRTGEKYWQGPLKWNGQIWRECRSCGTRWGGGDGYRPTCQKNECDWVRPRVFCASLADWLDDEVDIEWLADLLLIYQTPNLDWLLLTKRPQNWNSRLEAAIECHYQRTNDDPKTAQKQAWFRQWMIDWKNVNNGPAHRLIQPHANVWIGTTVKDQPRADERIPRLLSIPARVRFLSCEPLLRPVDLTPMLEHRAEVHNDTGIHWVICGGESGPGARPMDVAWARSIVSQCKEAGVPCLVKQLGARPASRKDAGPLYGSDFLALEDDPRYPDFFIHQSKDKKAATWPGGLATCASASSLNRR